MPKKIENCVEKIVKKQGVEKSQAFAICTNSIDGKSYMSDFSPDIKHKIDKTTGFLTLSTTLSRTGIQKYYGMEIGLEGKDRYKTFNVFRPPEEVFNKKSIDSFVNNPVTDDHPSDLVTVENNKEVQCGQVSHVEQEGDFLRGTATITNKDLISKILKGKVEVSVGYQNDLAASKGVHKGEKYDFIQTNIRANHLAIVDKGRCGSACKLTFDSKGIKNMGTLRLDGVDYEVDDQVKQAFDAFFKKKEEKEEEDKKDAKKKQDELEKEKSELKKSNDSLNGELDALKKTKMTDADIAKLVNDRAEIVSKAKGILTDAEFTACRGEKYKEAVAMKVLKDVDLTDKSEDYVNAMFDVAVKSSVKIAKQTKDVGDVLTDDKGDQVTRDSVRDAYTKKLLKGDV